MYVYYCNATLTTAMKNRSYKDMIRDFKYLTEDLKTRVIHPGFHLMDNKAYTALEPTMMTMNIKYQLVPPSNHRENNAGNAIKKLNNHFIAGLNSVDKDFHVQLWDRLLQQVKICLNLIRQPVTLPHISAYNHTFG